MCQVAGPHHGAEEVRGAEGPEAPHQARGAAPQPAQGGGARQ